jgi:hypothetical protein
MLPARKLNHVAFFGKAERTRTSSAFSMFTVGTRNVTRTGYPECHEDSYITCVLTVVIWNKIGLAMGLYCHHR